MARAATLFRDLALARADGSFRNLQARLSRIDVLVIDDWAMARQCPNWSVVTSGHLQGTLLGKPGVPLRH
jgi:hypothetical protein